MSQLAVPAAGYAVLAGSGVAAAASAQDALFGAAAAALVLLFVGIHNAWDSIASSAERRKKASDEGYLRLGQSRPVLVRAARTLAQTDEF